MFALLDDSSGNGVTPRHLEQARALLTVLQTDRRWTAVGPVPADPCVRHWDVQSDGFNCGCFALVHLERRLREVWAGERMRGALREEAAQRRTFLRVLLAVADKDARTNYT